MADIGRILISNDDGIHAPGLAAMEHIASQLSDDVWVVAPETEQSGASHSLTLHDPLRVRQVSKQKFAVKGTPSDCIMMAVKHLIPGAAPDLILSGVNRGGNLAEDVTYSGTIAAAMEGTILEIPSIAMSQVYRYGNRGGVQWSCAEFHAPAIVRQLFHAGWSSDVLININFPDVPHAKVEGVEITVQGRRDQSSTVIDARVDSRGNDYFWLGLERGASNPPAGTDLHAVFGQRISVTPLHLDLTHHQSQSELGRAFESFVMDVEA